MILLDTHVWLWWLLDEGPLTHEERETLHRHAKNKETAISAASVWEAEMLNRKGVIELYPDFKSWIELATRADVCKVVPIDEKVVAAQDKLPEDFPDDPADRLIVATALLNEYPLATKDEVLQDLGF
ncbi:type II toxin-antitoxin system VapC family toxin [Gracilimonas mengyeensis]|uniref:PIN domain nuclease, a component of toxin-antitoxin system (PIN domain) n=1 Tax=Gracilimonas mengyeensis TaxID=1302730 RepID=A0A521BYU7_9BACT|nr:type II toxin-antitoxin system VapC family toxin [Gracilimonas mengyeensis]SMO52362.1 PIN domain nuclease, a component of toxin-antitoxin system (PIN domain) [Gracilimonas mengyeensis]